jgi:hypothetical protein
MSKQQSPYLYEDVCLTVVAQEEIANHHHHHHHQQQTQLNNQTTLQQPETLTTAQLKLKTETPSTPTLLLKSPPTVPLCTRPNPKPQPPNVTLSEGIRRSGNADVDLVVVVLDLAECFPDLL